MLWKEIGKKQKQTIALSLLEVIRNSTTFQKNNFKVPKDIK